jgi:alpha-ketoglutarate-dependent 2,4-dichlorophenoxyacetate dioxygenase
MAIEVRPIHPEFVAEIDGIELGRPVDRAAVDKIWRAIDRYAVRVFHDQHLDDERLRDFANHFGELEIGRAAAEAAKRCLALP